MDVWIIDPFDAIPGETWGHRHGIFLGQKLRELGLQVTFFTASFAHATKEQRSHGWKSLTTEDGVKIQLIPVRSYRKHIGITRILSFLDFAWRLWRHGRGLPAPAVIFTSIPAPFTDIVSVMLARRHGAKLVTEFRDLWPELFEGVFPARLRPLGRLLLAPLYAARTFAFRESAAVTAVCEAYRLIAIRTAPNLESRPNLVVYHTGVERDAFLEMMRDSSEDASIIPKQFDEIRAIYAGTIGMNYDIPCLMEAARILSQRASGPKICIIVAGDGPLVERLNQFIEDHHLENLKYVGALPRKRLYRYYNSSDIGLAPYASDSTVGMPAKAYDLYTAELPIVNSLPGEFARFLELHHVGVNYRAGDPESLAEAIFQLASDPQRLQVMRSSLARLAPEYDRRLQYAKYEELLRSLSTLNAR